MNEFINLTKKLNTKINLQIIKSLSLLVINLSNKETLYYIFSNNFINDIISIIHSDSNHYETDFLSYYINFIKTLSLKIDDTTINFFFQHQKNQFPLLDSALKLYNHPDSMINNVVRNIFLSIIKTKSLSVIDYMSSLPNVTYFIFLSYRVRDTIFFINDNSNTGSFETIKNSYDDIVNDIIFFQDIFSLKINTITFILTNCLFENIVLPLICFSLCFHKINTDQKKISVYLALNVLILFSFYINDEHFLNLLFGLLYSENISVDILNKILHEPQYLSFYSYEFKKEIELYSFEMFIAYNYSYKFIQAIQYMANSSYGQITDIHSKVINMIEKGSFDNQNNDNVVRFILNELEQYLTKENIDTIIDCHSLIALNTGLSINFLIKDQEQSPIIQFDKYWKQLTTNNQPLNEVKNAIRDCLYKLFEMIDDHLVLLNGLLMNILIKKNDIINKELLSMANLLPADDINSISVVDSNMFYDINSFDDNTYNFYFKKLNDTKIFDNINQDLQSNKQLIEKEQDNKQFSKLYKSIFRSDKDSSNDRNDNVVVFNSEYYNKFQITQKTYDKQLINSLFKIFEGLPIYRGITLRVILNTIEILITKTNSISTLNQEELNRINKAYVTSLMDITSFLKKYEIIRSECYSLFENEWKRYNKDIVKIIDELLKLPYFIFPTLKEQSLPDYPMILSNSKQSTNIFSVHLMIFMIFSDLRSKIYQDDKRIQLEFPLSFSSNNIEVGRKIQRSSIKNMFFIGKLKKETTGIFIDCSMFVHQNYLISINQDYKDKNMFVVKQKFPIRFFKMSEDPNDERNLLISTKGEEGNGVQIIIILDNMKMVKGIKDQFVNHCKIIGSEEYLLIDSYFTEQMNQFDKS